MPDALDQLAVGAWNSGRLDGRRLRYNRRFKQLFFHRRTGDIEEVPTILNGRFECDDNTGYDEYRPAQQPDGTVDAIFHTHQDRAARQYRLSPLPGPKDGIAPVHRRIPNYGLSSVGVWVVRPGLRVSVHLLDGVWGEEFNPEAFAEALARGAGNAAVGMGARCRRASR